MKVAATDAAASWFDIGVVREAAEVSAAGPGGYPDLVVVAPMTFNSLNRRAAGISDTDVLT